MVLWVVFALSISLSAPAGAAVTADQSYAVIYAYQRVGDDDMPHVSLSLEQFSAHIRELQKENYVVAPLADVIDAFKTGAALSPKTVVLTFDGAHTATLERIKPILTAAGYPYTVFFNSEAIDRQEPGSLTWDDLRKLSKDKSVELGILPAHYAHMVSQDMPGNTASINKAIGRFQEELGTTPRYFAWPYGEYTKDLKNKLSEYNFDAALGYHAGVAYDRADRLALPRFVLNDLSGDLDRFRQTAAALPLPVTDAVPEDPVLRDNPPLIGFTVSPNIRSLSGLACFVSGQGKVATTSIAGQRVELRPARPFNARRTRLNCTLPVETAPGEEPRWRWLGFIYVDPEFDEQTVIFDTSGFE